MPLVFECLFANLEKPLFLGCCKFTKLSNVLKLYNLKGKNGWSGRSFVKLLELLKYMFPNDNELPCSTYEAKKMLCLLGMEIKMIHVCLNDYDSIGKNTIACMCVQSVGHCIIKERVSLMGVRIKKALQWICYSIYI